MTGDILAALAARYVEALRARPDAWGVYKSDGVPADRIWLTMRQIATPEACEAAYQRALSRLG